MDATPLFDAFRADPATSVIVVDFDGTISPIVEDPASAAPFENVVEVLEKLAEQFGMDAEMVKKYLAKEQVQDQLLTQKAVAVVVDSATAEKPKKDETAEGEKKAKKAPAKKAAKKDEAAEGEKEAE